MFRDVARLSRCLLAAGGLLLSGPGVLRAQTPPAASAAPAAAPAPPPVDSVVVEGNKRTSAAQIVAAAGIPLGKPINYRDIQRAVAALFKTNQFDDVAADQRVIGERFVLVFRVRERPLLERWFVRGAQKLPESDVKDRVKLVEGRPLDRAAVERGRASIDSFYREKGYYAVEVKTEQAAQADGRIRVTYDIKEGSRVAIAQVDIVGNERFRDAQVVKAMASKPEGFLWFRKGEYDERRIEEDTRERLPGFYADNGYIDFQVLRDTLIADSASGKALLQLEVEEGKQYLVGNFEVSGNRRFSSDELLTYYPFTPPAGTPATAPKPPFNRKLWEEATEKVRNLYSNNGYIASQLQPDETRRTGPDGKSYIDLRWTIREGQPATINKIEIVGNDVTHERVIREAIVLLPGEVFNRDRLIRSYQNISNLNFFQQPLPAPDVQRSANGVDVDITFRIEERRTGNINFGASIGQGTGVGGFLGLEEPNLFGRGKRGRLQWQFGRNIQDLNLSYSDPAIRESRISGTIAVFDSRARFIIGDLGRTRRTGGNLQIGFPFFGSRYTRVFFSYGLQRISFADGAEDLRARFACPSCTRSTLGASLLRDTRIGLPFPTAGQLTSVAVEQNGGILGGTGNYQKVDIDTRWYTPLAVLGGSGQFGSGVTIVAGLTARSGFIFGRGAEQFFTELYSMGGVQFGIPLRGYQEFSITPNGFDPTSGTTRASPNAFGRSYALMSFEIGARVSQQLYFSTFFDAGNVYRSAQQYDPTRLFRGAGFGVAVLSPLGPIGIDLGYGFDRVDLTGRPAPGWQLHFRLGNFF